MKCAQLAAYDVCEPNYTTNWFPIRVASPAGASFEDELPLGALLVDADVTLFYYQNTPRLKLNVSLHYCPDVAGLKRSKYMNIRQ